jgi:putative DNA methylase
MDDMPEATRFAGTLGPTTRRLIEQWLPIAALSEESVRERRSMTALPPIYYLHVWWARRPLIVSRAALLASMLSETADHDRFLHALGIHGDPTKARRAIDNARRTGIRVDDPYGYERAFSYNLSADDRSWLADNGLADGNMILDPTAGGGSIPFEAARLGCSVLANDLNPVAALIEKATIEYPTHHGKTLTETVRQLGAQFRQHLDERLAPFFPQPGAPERLDITYLWARTIRCPYCDGLIPLSPNWRLAPDGTGVRLRPQLGAGPHAQGRLCSFEIVRDLKEQSAGTVANGDGTCPFTDCGRVVDGDEIKRQAQAGSMGEQLFAVVFRHRVETHTKSGKRGRDKWERGYRAPCSEDEISTVIVGRLREKLLEWEVLDLVPNERLPTGNKTTEPIRYNMTRWSDLFNARQLLGHGTGVEVFRELLSQYESEAKLTPINQAAFVYTPSLREPERIACQSVRSGFC